MNQVATPVLDSKSAATVIISFYGSYSGHWSWYVKYAWWVQGEKRQFSFDKHNRVSLFVSKSEVLSF